MRIRFESGGLDGQPHQVTNHFHRRGWRDLVAGWKKYRVRLGGLSGCKDDACNKQRDEELKKSKVKAKIFTKLLYRHWNAFTEFKRSHLFVDQRGLQLPRQRVPHAARDLTPGDHDVPPFNLGGQDMYAISPDGQELAYTSNIDEVEATSTNNEIFRRADGRRHAEENFHQSRQRHDAALFAGRKIHRLALAGSRRFRSR